MTPFQSHACFSIFGSTLHRRIEYIAPTEARASGCDNRPPTLVSILRFSQHLLECRLRLLHIFSKDVIPLGPRRFDEPPRRHPAPDCAPHSIENVVVDAHGVAPITCQRPTFARFAVQHPPLLMWIGVSSPQ